MPVQVRYGSYGTFSGPWIRGTCAFSLPASSFTASDLVMNAVAVPEGGAWDTIVAYDGTAMTAGLFQWTLTSGRLQKLLSRFKAVPGLDRAYERSIGSLFETLGVVLDVPGGVLRRGGKVLSDKDELRNLFTPPAGRVPKRGPSWEKARASALAFHSFFQEPAGYAVQANWFLTELCTEVKYKRPKLANLTTAEILYPKSHASSRQIELVDGVPLGWTCSLIGPMDPCRALFWSCWQNAPRQAETVLYQTYKRFGSLDEDLEKFTTDFARRVATSTFGNWGIAKAKANNRTSRYAKMAGAINAVVPGALPTRF